MPQLATSTSQPNQSVRFDNLDLNLLRVFEALMEETTASVRVTVRDCPGLQRPPSRTRPGDRPPVQKS